MEWGGRREAKVGGKGTLDYWLSFSGECSQNERTRVYVTFASPVT